MKRRRQRSTRKLATARVGAPAACAIHMHRLVATLSARSSAVRAWNGRSPGWRIGLGRARGGTPYHFDAKPCAAASSSAAAANAESHASTVRALSSPKSADRETCSPPLR